MQDSQYKELLTGEVCLNYLGLHVAKERGVDTEDKCRVNEGCDVLGGLMV